MIKITFFSILTTFKSLVKLIRELFYNWLLKNSKSYERIIIRAKKQMIKFW